MEQRTGTQHEHPCTFRDTWWDCVVANIPVNFDDGITAVLFKGSPQNSEKIVR